jgi:hypothetical protein
MCLTWAAALHFPTYYLPNRIQIVLVGRALMALSAYLATNGVQEQLYKTLMFPAAKLSLFLKMFLFCNTGQMPVESLRLQLPLLWQLAGTAGKAVALFLSEFTTGTAQKALRGHTISCLSVRLLTREPALEPPRQ